MKLNGNQVLEYEKGMIDKASYFSVIIQTLNAIYDRVSQTFKPHELVFLESVIQRLHLPSH